MGQEQGKLWTPIVRAPLRLCEVINSDNDQTLTFSEAPKRYDRRLGSDSLGQNERPTKRALVIAINYINTPDALTGSHNDANSIIPILKDLGFQKENIKILADVDIDEKDKHLPTRMNILKALDWLADDCEAGDVRCVFFMGLAAEVAASPQDPSLKLDVILPSDYQQGGSFNCISERDLVQSFAYIPSGVQVILFMDTSVHWNLRDPTFGCACGSANKISRQKAARVRKGCTDARARYSCRVSSSDIAIADGGRKIMPAPLACDMYCFSSVRSGQVAIECEIEGTWQGAFTYLVCEILADRIERAHRTGHFRLTFSSLYQELGSALSQLKTSTLQSVDQDIYFSHTLESGASAIAFHPNAPKATTPTGHLNTFNRNSDGVARRVRPPPTPPKFRPRDSEDYYSHGSSSMMINYEGSAASSSATCTPSETPFNGHRGKYSFMVDEKRRMSSMKPARRKKLISGCVDDGNDLLDYGSFNSQNDIPPPPPTPPMSHLKYSLGRNKARKSSFYFIEEPDCVLHHDDRTPVSKANWDLPSRYYSNMPNHQKGRLHNDLNRLTNIEVHLGGRPPPFG